MPGCKHKNYTLLTFCDKKNPDIVRYMFKCKACRVPYNSEIMQHMVDNTAYRRGVATTPGANVIDNSWYAYTEELMRKTLREGVVAAIVYGE